MEWYRNVPLENVSLEIVPLKNVPLKKFEEQAVKNLFTSYSRVYFGLNSLKPSFSFQKILNFKWNDKTVWWF